MSGSRIIVVMLIVALSFSGWVAQVQAFGNPSLHLSSTSGGSEGHAGKADCPDAAAKGLHDHSDPASDCCHLVAPGLDLFLPAVYPARWAPRTAFLPSPFGAVTSIMSSPILRPPRV